MKNCFAAVTNWSLISQSLLAGVPIEVRERLVAAFVNSPIASASDDIVSTAHARVLGARTILAFAAGNDPFALAAYWRVRESPAWAQDFAEAIEWLLLDRVEVAP